MQCRIEEKTIRSIRRLRVKCFKYGKEEHKCRECPLSEKKEKRVPQWGKGAPRREEAGASH